MEVGERRSPAFPHTLTTEPKLVTVVRCCSERWDFVRCARLIQLARKRLQ